MIVDSLTAELCRQWDEYVYSRPEATFFHLSAWRLVIEQAFGHTHHYLLARRQDEIVGILPLVHVDSPLFGASLIANAFCVYGGIVADDEAAYQALCDQARQLARQLRVGHLELRNLERRHPHWPGKDLYVTFSKSLHDTEQANWLALPGKRRNQIRAALRHGLQARCVDDIDRFYHCYAESVRNLGTPVFAKRYFQLLQRHFGAACEIMLVEYHEQTVAAVMSFYFRDQVLPYYAGGTRSARRLHAYDFLYWRLMCRALDKGCRHFDFGRSKRGTGAYRYKQLWGCDERQLNYEYDLVAAEQMPELNPLNPKFRLMIAVWKRLPLPLSKLIGPWLARDLG